MITVEIILPEFFERQYDVHQLLADDGVNFIQKPFSLSDLAVKVRTLPDDLVYAK